MTLQNLVKYRQAIGKNITSSFKIIRLEIIQNSTLVTKYTHEAQTLL